MNALITSLSIESDHRIDVFDNGDDGFSVLVDGVPSEAYHTDSQEDALNHAQWAQGNLIALRRFH